MKLYVHKSDGDTEAIEFGDDFGGVELDLSTKHVNYPFPVRTYDSDEVEVTLKLPDGTLIPLYAPQSADVHVVYRHSATVHIERHDKT